MRVKKLREKKSEDRLKEPFVALKILVDKSMIVQKARHEQLVANFEKRQKEFLEKLKTDPNAKKPRQPGKVFSWDLEMKEALLKLIQTKKDLYTITRPRGTTVEDWVKQYMDEELKVKKRIILSQILKQTIKYSLLVKVIWPSGWMNLKNLEKIVKPVLVPATPATPAPPVSIPVNDQPTPEIVKSNGTQSGKPVSQPVQIGPSEPSSVNITVDLTGSDSPVNPQKPALPIVTGKKRKSSENALNYAPPMKNSKKIADISTNGAQNYNLKEVSVSLTPVSHTIAALAPNIMSPVSSNIKPVAQNSKPVVSPKSQTPAASQKTANSLISQSLSLQNSSSPKMNSQIMTDMERLKNLKQLIRGQSPKEGSRKSDQKVDQNSPITAGLISSGSSGIKPSETSVQNIIKQSTPRKSEKMKLTNFSVSKLTSPVKADTGKIPVLINQQNGNSLGKVM